MSELCGARLSEQIQTVRDSSVKTDEKIQSIDIIRVISMFCVIFLHCASNRLRVNMYTPGWHIVNALTALAGSGVPLFFMISGALILGSKNTLSVSYTLKKRVLRLIVPLFAWSAIAIAVNLYTDSETGVSLGNICGRLIHFLNKPSAVHMWFMYYLIPMYLISPALKLFMDNAEEKTILYILLLWLLQMLSLTLGGVLREESHKALAGVSFINNIGFISGYLGYFMLGSYIMKSKIKLSPVLLVIIIASTAVFICAGTEYISRFNDFYTETFKSYRSIFIVILSFCAFMLLKEAHIKNNGLSRLVSALSAVSYGVYLSHNCIIDVLNRWGLKNHSLMQIALCFVITSVSSVVIIGVMSRIKYISYIFAGIKKSKKN